MNQLNLNKEKSIQKCKHIKSLIHFCGEWHHAWMQQPKVYKYSQMDWFCPFPTNVSTSLQSMLTKLLLNNWICRHFMNISNDIKCIAYQDRKTVVIVNLNVRHTLLKITNNKKIINKLSEIERWISSPKIAPNPKPILIECSESKQRKKQPRYIEY